MSDVEVIASREIRNSRDVKSSSRSSVEQRSRNKSIEKKPHKKSSRSLSRSRSQSRRSASRESSKSGKDRNDITRDNPVPCKCLGVFGLSLYTKERDLKDMFRKCGPIDHCTIVYDRRTGRSRGFGFVRFRHQDDADEARELMNGKEFDSRKIRVDYSVTQRPHSPTPGVYMGKTRDPPRSSRYDDRRDRRRYSRSRSPRSRTRSRSRSRSYDRRR
uniref:Transformer-2 protein homolog alpha (Trinotate prediction) n=1 Tax=Henneguya salminicola TaxID=69463 RepID=A0A6G3MGN8_HENSL